MNGCQLFEEGGFQFQSLEIKENPLGIKNNNQRVSENLILERLFLSGDDMPIHNFIKGNILQLD